VKRNALLALTAGAVLLVLAGAFWLSHGLRGPAPVLGPTVNLLDDGRALPEFHLPSTQGEFSNATLLGHWTFVLFGYTHCPDVCPTSLALLSEVTRQLQGKTVPPQVVFVSVDAPRDGIELLKRYVPAFNPAFIGATGSDAALKPLTRDLGVYYVRNVDEAPGGGSYSVDHTSSFFLIAPDGSLRAVFQWPQEAPQMARDTAAIMAR
jgi:protein SCO1/2